MNLIGLDLSLTATGVAWNADDGLHTATLRSKHTGMARLADLRNAVLQIAAGAHLVCVEGYSMGTARQQSHAHGLGELGGVVRLALWEARIPYIDIAPATVKKVATGKGNAGKNDVLAEAIKRLGYGGSSNDEADAAWLLQAGLQWYQLPGIVPLPAAHRDGIGKAAWPTRKVLGLAEPALETTAAG